MRMKRLKALSVFFLAALLAGNASSGRAEEKLFTTIDSKKEFASEISGLLGKAWKKWQDSVLINDIDVNGARGTLRPGDMAEPVLSSNLILADFDSRGRSQAYVDALRAVSGAVGEGMRCWQRGYTHGNIPFPQGASCSYTLSPCNNVPVTVVSGASPGAGKMSEKELYSFMLYRTPADDEEVKEVLRASARAVSLSFRKWERSCSIIGIAASGGIAPTPAPMGTGPGPVKGAKGEGGKLVGAYFDDKYMYDQMVEYFETRE